MSAVSTYDSMTQGVRHLISVVIHCLDAQINVTKMFPLCSWVSRFEKNKKGQEVQHSIHLLDKRSFYPYLIVRI